VPLQEFESDFEADGDTIEFDAYNQAVAGSITVAKSGEEYTVSFELELDDGSTLSGSSTGEFRGRGDYDWYRLPSLGNGNYAILVDDEWSSFVGDPDPSDTLVEVYAADGTSPPQGDPIVIGQDELDKMNNPIEFTVEAGQADTYIKLYSDNPGPDSHQVTVEDVSRT